MGGIEWNADRYAQSVQLRYDEILQRVKDALNRSGRPNHKVTFIAVTKYIDLAQTVALCRTGITDLGENRWQVARPKVEAGLPVTWHFIGPIQSNKVQHVARHFDYVHSVDRPELARALSSAALKAGRNLKILYQVNVSGELQKSGIPPTQLEELVGSCLGLEGLQPVGLMLIGNQTACPNEARESFARLRELRDHIQRVMGVVLPELSMGMSADFETAVEEGSTMIRVGRHFVLPQEPF